MSSTFSSRLSRREFAGLSAAATLALVSSARADSVAAGHVIGEATSEIVGQRVLADGGNAVDAIVAAALASAIVSPSNTGIGGYGMSAVIALDGGKRVVAIDGNSAAPASMPADLFQRSENGKPPAGLNPKNSLVSVGWLSAGVPGVLAGLQLALDRFGTKKFSELVQPAIKFARDGFPWPQNLATAIGNRRDLFYRDPGSRKLFFPGGEPARVGEPFKNLELAELLESLAKAGSVEPFYRGDIAQRIADGFQKNGGLVTARDMAAYEARGVEPATIKWGAHTIHTAPLTAGGMSVLQMLQTLRAMNWNEWPDDPVRTHARVEAMRLAWRDRLTLLGDPAHAKVPVAKLLSDEYAAECGQKIQAVVKAGKFLAHRVTPRDHTGTINLSAVDRHGNFVALTLSHGNGFGACVTVDGLGLTLGHGMSRFDPSPDHPNAPGPGKRPLHNMTPTVVLRDGRPVLAVGGAGGRKIPNSLMEILTRYVALGRPFVEAMNAPRIHTEGTTSLALEKS